jgi:hypothetical protein
MTRPSDDDSDSPSIEDLERKFSDSDASPYAKIHAAIEWTNGRNFPTNNPQRYPVLE